MDVYTALVTGAPNGVPARRVSFKAMIILMTLTILITTAFMAIPAFADTATSTGLEVFQQLEEGITSIQNDMTALAITVATFAGAAAILILLFVAPFSARAATKAFAGLVLVIVGMAVMFLWPALVNTLQGLWGTG